MPLSIYRASAGSGKTFTLTAEYVRIVVQPKGQDEYQSTLAVTFTNKATAEMKDRILTSLYAIAHGTAESEDMLRAVEQRLRETGTPMGHEAIREGCRKALSDILHDYSHFRVETIDSFFQSILRNMARELGLSANLQVELSDDEVRSRAVDRIIGRLDREPRTRKNMMDFLHEKMDDGEHWSIAEDVKRFSRHIYDTEFQNRSQQEKDLLSDPDSIGRLRRELKERENALRQQMETPLAAMEQAYLQSGLMEDNRIKANQNRALLTGVQKLREGKIPDSQAWTSFIGEGVLPVKKAYSDDPELAGKGLALHECYGRNYDEALTLLTELNTIALTRRNLGPLSLLDTIDREITAMNGENDRFDLARTPLLLAALLEGTDAPFYFEKTGVWLHNVMIDEFQDTSTVQWQVFRTLLFENQATGGSNLIVGDIKQSIYRWRGGMWTLLHHLADELRQWKPDEVTLSTNWRSGSVVTEFNNDFFTRMTDLLDGMDDNPQFRISDIYNDVCQKASPKKKGLGYVRIRVVSDKNDEEEDECLGAMMQEMIQLHEAGLPYEEMAILCRYNDEIRDVVRYFNTHAPSDLRLVSDEAFMLGSSDVVQLIVDAMRILVTPEEKNAVPYRSFIRRYHRVMHPDETADEAALMLTPIRTLLPTPLAEEKERLATLPLYHLMESLYKMLHLERAEGEEAYWLAFTDTVREHIVKYDCSISGFLEAWEDTYQKKPIPSGKVNGTRILTIHKSKGLEYHSVFIPSCDWEVEKDDHRNILWSEAQTDKALYRQIGMMPVSEKASMAESYFNRRYKEEHLHKRVDTLNTLYVAFTRAAMNLYVWAHAGEKGKGRDKIPDIFLKLLGDGSRDMLYTLGKPEYTPPHRTADNSNRMKPQEEAIPVQCHSYAARLHFIQSNDSRQFTGEREAKVERGKLYHYIFSQIRDVGDVSRVMAEVSQRGLVEDNHEREHLHEYVSEVMKTGLAKEWFSPDNDVWNECNILIPKKDGGKHLRPDRVVRRGNRITVIDYKFGHPHPSYPAQVRGYMSLISTMYPECEVEGYIWYVDTNTYMECKKGAEE